MRQACRAWVILLAVLLTSSPGHAAPAAPPDISGTWQVRVEGEHPARFVWQISRGSSGAYQLLGYDLEQGPDSVKANSVSVNGMTVKVSVESIGGVYEGTLSQDQKSLSGTWTIGGVTTPLVLQRATKSTAWKIPPSPHNVRFVTVDHNVRLEVLDFGGGRSTGGRSADEKKSQPIVLLTGLGNNAHVFDNFAPKLTASHHVYAITRRGFGESSAPADGYSADRLGDDVLEVLQALRISRPVLMGHSIAGEELSSIGTRHPELVAGLVYLDAGYMYALYNGGDLNYDVDELRKKLDVLRNGDTHVAQQLLATDLPRLNRDLQAIPKDAPPPSATPVFIGPPPPPASMAIMAGERKYGPVTAVPILAIFADPPNLPQLPGLDPVAQAANQALMTEGVEAQAVAFEKAGPNVHVVRIPHADHYVFHSNEAEVLREINAFMAGLPPIP